MPTTVSTYSASNNQKLWDIRTLDRMNYFLRYNIEIFLQLYSYFVQNNLQAIVDYYSNSINNPDSTSFDFLDDLISEMKKIKALITLNKDRFRQIDDWELLDFLEDVHTKLITIQNTDRWTRSSRTQNSWKGNALQTTYTLNDDQTLEAVSEVVYGAKTAQNDWTRIAIENDLSERDYAINGGNIIKITKQNLSSPNYFANSIVDNLVDQKMYGLDINKKIQFVNNDLDVLNYNDTFVQTVGILITLKKGDAPEFSAIGVDPALSVGASYGSLKFSSIVRQLQEIFETDDSTRNFSVTNISYNNGALSIGWQVDSLYNLTYGNTTVIQQQ